MIHDSGGSERAPEPGLAYYLDIISELDLSDVLMPFSPESISRQALIDGGAERGWYGGIVYDIDEDRGVFIVGNATDRSEPHYDFPEPESTLDFERALDKITEVEVARSQNAVDEFINAIDDAANPN